MLVLDAEKNAPGSNIRTFGNAIWWALTTVSTVGYGDHYPVTFLGRAIALVLIVAGVSLFGIVTAAIASVFVQHFQDQPAPEGDDLPARLDRLEQSMARIEAALTDRQTA